MFSLFSFPLHSHPYISLFIVDTLDVPVVDMKDRERILQLEQAQCQLLNQLHHFISQPVAPVPPPPPPPPPPIVLPPQPYLNLPTPPSFSGLATKLPEFKMKMRQFLNGNPHTYTTCDEVIYVQRRGVERIGKRMRNRG